MTLLGRETGRVRLAKYSLGSREHYELKPFNGKYEPSERPQGLSFFSSAGLACHSLWLVSFPSFSLFLSNPANRVSSNNCLKARHKADSFEPTEWSGQHLSGRAD